MKEFIIPVDRRLVLELIESLKDIRSLIQYELNRAERTLRAVD